MEKLLLLLALQGKTTLTVALTIGHSGIGYQTSCLFATQGCRLVLADINIQALEDLRDKIIEMIKDPALAPETIQCDVSVEAQVKEAVDRAVSKWGGLDIMFNNAGIMHPKDDDALTTTEAIWYYFLRINEEKGI